MDCVGFWTLEGCGGYPQVFRAQQNEEETHKAMGCKVVWHGVSEPKEGKEAASPKQCQCLSGLRGVHSSVYVEEEHVIDNEIMNSGGRCVQRVISSLAVWAQVGWREHLYEMTV